MRITKNKVFFWGSVFSQWNKDSDHLGFQFKKGEVKFSSCEQFMMYHKAILFDDVEIARKILSISDVKKIKDLGREVKNFDNATWDKYKFDIVVEGNYLKFAQNKSLLKQLMAHKDKKFVEASPKDRIWGIGLHWEDDLVLDEKNWKGQNLLGKALDKVVDLLKD